MSLLLWLPAASHAHGTGRSLNSFGISDPPSAVVETGWYVPDLLKKAGTPRTKRGEERERKHRHVNLLAFGN